MPGLALQILFVVCCTAPFVVMLQVRSARASAGWCATALLAAVLSLQANPLAVAMRHVDGTVLRGGCGNWLAAPRP